MTQIEIAFEIDDNKECLITLQGRPPVVARHSNEPRPYNSLSTHGMSEQKTDAQMLLEVANTSSERLAVLHTGFMATCVYVLVIVFGTTDLDLLIGKGVQLPVVNVAVPIVGFYVFAPFILVLVHFNLLLQLQLLSRKLHAFDSAAAPEDDEIGGLRDRLHIFPFTYYIAGRPGHRVQPFVALMVSITVIMLPLITLLSLQMEFLAYQEELYTWLQRIAIWIDIATVAYFWPLIINPSGSLRDYYRDLYRAHLPRKRDWIPLGLFVTGLIFVLFGSTLGVEDTEKIADRIVMILPFLAGILLISISTIGTLFLRKSRPLARFGSLLLALLGAGTVFFLISSWLKSPDQVKDTSIAASIIALIVFFAILLFWQHEAPRGSLVLHLSVFLCFPLTLAMLVDGESLEHRIITIQGSHEQSTLFCNLFLKNKRILELQEQILLAKQPQPETLALIRSDEWEKGIRQIEPLDLKGRKLRHANLIRCILARADLRKTDLKGAFLLLTQLQGAELSETQLQGADLYSAQLQGADLYSAQLQGTDLSSAQLQGANLLETQLQGADLSYAQLQGAYLSFAQLQGADLSRAQLQGADLYSAQLQGTDLSFAQLQGANLLETQLQGVDLRNANIYGAAFSSESNTSLIDARDIFLMPIPDLEYFELCNNLQAIKMKKFMMSNLLNRLQDAINPDRPTPTLDSCLISENSPIKCTHQLHEPEYTEKLHAYLVDLACSSPDIAHGIISQIKKSNDDKTSSRIGLKAKLRERLKAGNCKGLVGLTDEEKRKLLDTRE
jgi:uncharacterized protein YjbI with pentapeptide repeats